MLIDNERCIGCRFCIAACPYSARVFNWFEPRDAEKYEGVTYNIEANVPQKKGTISKCLFSADRLRDGQASLLRFGLSKRGLLVWRPQ